MTESSHPPALLRRTARTLREETPLARGDRIVVAVSGGGDSIALLHVFARLAHEFGVELCAHGVDHGLRPEASAELDLAERLAASLGVAFSRTVLALADGGNLQARARDARYAALDAVREREGARWVATAHHADDRAETVMMRILRGTSPRGLAVLPAAAPHRLRPFIRSRRSAIARHLERHGLSHASDPSNRASRFLRTRIRYELIPLLESLAPGASERLNQLADEWAEPGPMVVTDAQGRELPVRRSQVAQIRRAQKLKRSLARVWLPGGLEIIPCGDSSGVEAGVEAAAAGGDQTAVQSVVDVGTQVGVAQRAPGQRGSVSRQNMARGGPHGLAVLPQSPKSSPRWQQNPAGRGAKPTKSD